MATGLFGTHENAVNKQRIIIPSQFRNKFNPNNRNVVVITIGSGKDIAIFPLDNWNQLMEKLSNSPEKEEQLNLMIEYASEETLEGPGRVKLPTELIKIAEITKSVVIKGMKDYLSVIAPHIDQQNKMAMLKARTSKPSDYRL